MTRKFYSTLFLFVALATVVSVAKAETISVDVCVYGATPGGIAASVSAAKSGKTVALVEPSSQVGGLATSGLSHTDFHSFESLSGAYLEFANRVQRHYATNYGEDSPQYRDCFRGTFAEPKVNLLVFEQMLDEQSDIALMLKTTLNSVSLIDAGDKQHVESATFHMSNNDPATIKAKVFIDATYEGDLIAMARVPYRVGREGRGEFGESLAPEKADSQLQAYNFRFCMTKDEDNRVTPTAPPGYRREDFVGVLDALASGRIKAVFDYPKDCIFKAQTPPLPNGKYDINDVSNSLVRLSLPGSNIKWPEGSAADRAAVFAEHLRDQAGLLYFLQNDDAVPARFRDEAKLWGWCKDEFTETNHLPPQLYVREARRMVGQHVFSQRDSEHAEDGQWRDARATLHRDSIAMADYGNNCHGTDHQGPRFGGRHTGDFYNPVPPYQIPYGVILPKSVDNLLVCGAVSSTHVGFCALRLEPVWMSLGQAAGCAAAQSIDEAKSVQSINIAQLQRTLVADKSATIYVSDVLPDSPDFAAVQWWGTRGGLHGLEPMPQKPGQRGKNIHGQYYEANPGHQANLDAPMTQELRERWKSLLPDGVDEPSSATTRGDWIREVYRTSIARDNVSKPVGDSAVVTDMQGLVAFWTFGEKAGQPRKSVGTQESLPLVEVGGEIERDQVGPFSGYSAKLDGKHYFKIAYEETGKLNISGPDAQVSMFAVVRIVDLKQSRTIAGMWSEGKGANDDSGTRQYALLMNMPTYGGPNKLVPHISSEGGVTQRADGTKFPWCADYAVSAQDVPTERWCTLGFTYDGKFTRAYVDGVMKSPDFDPVTHRRNDRYFLTEGPDGGPRGWNPYYHGRGIFKYDAEKHAKSKPMGGSDFTVGARYAVGSFSREATIGHFGGLAVFDRALSDDEMMNLHNAAAAEKLNQ